VSRGDPAISDNADVELFHFEEITLREAGAAGKKLRIKK
jgi:hypothetical protein